MKRTITFTKELYIDAANNIHEDVRLPHALEASVHYRLLYDNASDGHIGTLIETDISITYIEDSLSRELMPITTELFSIISTYIINNPS